VKKGMHSQTFRFPDELWQELVRSAEHNLRSVNSEVTWILREHFLRVQEGEGSGGAGSRGSGGGIDRMDRRK
jgi:hypothetical protein